MKYDFDKIVDRRHTNSLKWDVAEGELPMWVADMVLRRLPEYGKLLKKGQPREYSVMRLTQIIGLIAISTGGKSVMTLPCRRNG